MLYDQNKFPCPCCGHLVFEWEPGFHQVCPICGWEDDLSQLRFPLMPGSANGVGLFDAQQNFQSYGGSERRNLSLTRDPVEGEVVEPGWRPLDPIGTTRSSPAAATATGIPLLGRITSSSTIGVPPIGRVWLDKGTLEHS